MVVLLFVLVSSFQNETPIEPVQEAVSEEGEEFIGAARDLCVNHGAGISMHIHPLLEIYIEDEQVFVPPNIGIDAQCMRALHTHEGTGKIHVEYPEPYEFTLGDFFAVWRQPFNKDQIFDYVPGDTHQIRMTVDGVENTDYEDLVLEDLQQIVIYYEEI